MAAIGNSPTQQAFTPAVDYFSGNNSTTAFTLSRPVASVAQVQVVIDNVAQNPSSAYTVSSNTITFTSAPLSGTNNIYVYYTSPITQVIAPGQGTVTTTSLASSTGTGAVVLATSPTLVTPVLGAASATSITVAAGAVGTPSITTTGDTNTGIFFPAADTIAFSEGGSESMRIDSSGNVGIGTASPTAKLTVNNATAADYLSLTTAGSTKGVLADEAGDLIIKSAASLLFQTNGSIRARLNTTGAFVLAGGTTTANGIGITFPATQSASSNANTLDDYEEGTFTPSMSPSSGSWTTATTTGRYVKVGQTVTLFMSLTITTVGTGSGFIAIGSMPFTAFDPLIGAGNRAGVGIAREDATTGVAYQVFINGNSVSGNLQGFVTPTTVTMGNGYVFEMSLQYITAT
jgi:hypothetical protein